MYSPLLQRLGRRYHVTALAMRCMWPNVGGPPKQRDWQVYVDDLIAFLEKQNQGPVIGMGHSMGAACSVLAAQQRPDLFSALVLIETVMVTRTANRVMRLLPRQLMLRTQPAKGTLAKTDAWDSRQRFVDSYSRHRAYKRFDAEAWMAVEQHGVTEAGNGTFRLAFPKQWEAHNYTLPLYLIDNLAALSIPCVSIQTKPSLFCAAPLWAEWRQRCPETVFLEAPEFGHLLPLESAQTTDGLIQRGLESIGFSIKR